MYNIVKRNHVKGITYMKPRIFISSTFYDLKYIREDLSNFVRSYGYEPILFEDGDIGYTPGKTLDSSCYESMRNSDMVILIIGGEYGSAASGEKKDEFKEYMSVTRNEFRTAVESGIPIFVMIDKKVMAEYGVYEANYDDIEKENRIMVFPTTKSVNVFRFIKEIKGIVTLPIQEFERSSDIKGFISKQWADMFKNYLSFLRGEKENKKIESSVNEMKTLIQKMNIMLDSVGKNVLSKNNPEEYKNVVEQQEILSFCNTLAETFVISLDDEKPFDCKNSKAVLNKLLNGLKEAKKRGLSNDVLDENEEKIDEFFDLFEDDIFYVKNIFEDGYDNLYERISLLYNDKNMEKVIAIMSEDNYFNKLLKE